MQQKLKLASWAAALASPLVTATARRRFTEPARPVHRTPRRSDATKVHIMRTAYSAGRCRTHPHFTITVDLSTHTAIYVVYWDSTCRAATRPVSNT